VYREPIVENGEVVGVICPDCLTLREQRSIRAEQARVVRRLKRGLPLYEPGWSTWTSCRPRASGLPASR
jgi:hypothetical protein